VFLFTSTYILEVYFETFMYFVNELVPLYNLLKCRSDAIATATCTRQSFLSFSAPPLVPTPPQSSNLPSSRPQVHI
jgi:hypothetical protein